jgi:hypothetical protein
MGPGAGDEGGQIAIEGIPTAVANACDSRTVYTSLDAWIRTGTDQKWRRDLALLKRANYGATFASDRHGKH